MSALVQTRWRPVEHSAWTRRAYGRRVVCETQGGALCASLPNDTVPLREIHFSLEVQGRMLVQLFINDALEHEELVSHGEIDRFILLKSCAGQRKLDLELDLIPATTGEAQVSQLLSALPQNQCWPGFGSHAKPSCARPGARQTQNAQ